MYLSLGMMILHICYKITVYLFRTYRDLRTDYINSLVHLEFLYLPETPHSHSLKSVLFFCPDK